MSLFTLVGRIADGMPLVGTQNFNQQLRSHVAQAKTLLRSFTSASPAKCSVASGPYVFHYILEDGVCYLVLADTEYPRQLAFQYLEAVQDEFTSRFLDQVPMFSRPYAAVQFDPVLGRIRRKYLDPRDADNVRKLTENLAEIQTIMRRNIDDVLQRGAKMDHVAAHSSRLRNESKKFRRSAKWINVQHFLKSMLPVAAAVLLVLLVLYLKYR